MLTKFPYHRSLFLCFLADANTDRLVYLMSQLGWTGKSVVPESIEIGIAELRDFILRSTPIPDYPSQFLT